MAKTIEEYKAQIVERFMTMSSVRELYGLKGSEKFDERFPAVSVEGIFIYLWAFGAWVIATLFDRHRQEVDERLAALKPHTLRWYVTKAKAYQHGDELPQDGNGQPNSDKYARIDETKQLIRYAVAQEVNNTVLLKVAKYTSKDNKTPTKLSDEEITGFKYYLSQIKDAGVPVAVVSNAPDDMVVSLKIAYNPMTLTLQNGVLLDTDGNNVVRNAIVQVIENLPFNGDCRNSDILNAVLAIQGIDVADIKSVQVKAAGTTVLAKVIGYCTPESGYFRLATLIIDAAPYSYGNEI